METTDSILKTISHMIGPSEDYEYFNPDLIVHINTAFSRLCQLGVGPKKPFCIEDESDEWGDFISDENNMRDVRDYIYFNVKHDFDPPQNSFLMDALEKKIEKLEWLLNSVAEVGY